MLVLIRKTYHQVCKECQSLSLSWSSWQIFKLWRGERWRLSEMFEISISSYTENPYASQKLGRTPASWPSRFKGEGRGGAINYISIVTLKKQYWDLLWQVKGGSGEVSKECHNTLGTLDKMLLSFAAYHFYPEWTTGI